MKKFAILLLLASVISACTPQNVPETPDTPDVPAPEAIRHELLDELDASEYNVFSENMFDFDSDGEDDTVTLWTNAEVVDGEFMYDDGQHWKLTVETANGFFDLYDEYVQLGAAEIDIGEFYNEKPEAVIILTLTTGAGKSITHYVFKDGVFLEEQAYSTDDYAEGGTNIVISSHT